jgi:hypothetical protein
LCDLKRYLRGDGLALLLVTRGRSLGLALSDHDGVAALLLVM